MDAESLAKKILAADPAILRVLVIDEQGGEVAHVDSEAYGKKDRLGMEEEKKVARLDSLAIGMFQQEEKVYGAMDFILLAFKESKVMLTYSQKHGVYLALRILRSANAEYLHTKIRPIVA